MKTNIKIRVTPEQSKTVQEICFKNNIGWGFEGKYKDIKHLEQSLLFIYDKHIAFAYYDNAYFVNNEKKEIDADLFIRTNGTCEETSDEGLSKIKAASEGKSTEYLQEKIINLHKQINKDRATIKNQKEELHKLNLKLQKCIGLEEHRKVINWHIERNQSLFAEIDNLKAENIKMGKLVNLDRSALGLMGATKDLSISRVEEQNKEIEKLKAVIEYLESKVK